MTVVSVYSRTHSITYVSENILRSLKEIVRTSGLDVDKFTHNWDLYHRGISTWIQSGHLEKVELEIIDPRSNSLVCKWEIQISYAWSSGNGSFWADTDQLQYHLRKVGLAPSDAWFRVLATNKPGKPTVDGWTGTNAYPTEGMVRQSLGGTIEHHGLGANTAYWRKVG